MIDERFIIDKDGITIIDTIDDNLCECKYSYEAQKFIEKANKLVFQNQSLKRQILSSNKWYDIIMELIDDKIALYTNAKIDMIQNDDDYRLKQISFAIQCLREIKHDLEIIKGD